jgi:hypothetical protein
MSTGTLSGASKLPGVPTLFIEILCASLDTPKRQCLWGIVRNIPLPFSSFARSRVVGGETLGRHERSRGIPREQVCKNCAQCWHLRPNCGRQRTQMITKHPQFRPGNLHETVRIWEFTGRAYQARSSLAPGASMRMSTGRVALVSPNLRVV